MTDRIAHRSRSKRLLQGLALSLTSLALFLAACEIALRIAGYGNLEIYDPDPSLYWRLRPNQNCFTKIGRKPVHINSHGTRGPEFETAKPSRAFRVLSLGDSRTFGWGLTEAETYSSQLQVLLQKKAGPGRKIEVINAGVNAWSYPQMLLYFRDTGLQFQPDVVVLAEANLWTQFSEKNSADFVQAFMWRVRLKNSLRRFALYHWVVEVQLREFYERHRTKFIPVDPKQDPMFKEQQQRDPEAVFRSAIEELCKTALTNGITPVLLFLPKFEDPGATDNSLILKVKRGISASLRVPLVDLTADFRPLGKELYLEADPVHLNSRGNEMIARRLFEAVSYPPTQ
jgi:lysophospholipase L1-like esterase